MKTSLTLWFLFSLLGLTFAAESVLIVDTKGRSFKGIPVSINEKEVEVLRLPNKKKYTIPLSSITGESVERAREYLLKAAEQKKLDQARVLNEARSKMHVYTEKFKLGRVVYYSRVKDCVTSVNGYKSGVSLRAPDRSSFGFYNLSREGVKDMKSLREFVNTKLKERLKFKVAEERSKILEKISVVPLEIHGWKGFEILNPEELSPTAHRTCYLTKDGVYCGFGHSVPTGKGKIDKKEWELILKYMKLE